MVRSSNIVFIFVADEQIMRRTIDALSFEWRVTHSQKLNVAIHCAEHQTAMMMVQPRCLTSPYVVCVYILMNTARFPGTHPQLLLLWNFELWLYLFFGFVVKLRHRHCWCHLRRQWFSTFYDFLKTANSAKKTQFHFRGQRKRYSLLFFFITTTRTRALWTQVNNREHETVEWSKLCQRAQE